MERSAEVVDMLMSKKVDVSCLPETRWKGEWITMTKANNENTSFIER